MGAVNLTSSTGAWGAQFRSSDRLDGDNSTAAQMRGAFATLHGLRAEMA